MDPLAQQLTQRLIDQPVPLDARLPGKSGGAHLHREVAFAARIVPGMAVMMRAVVGHDQPFGLEGGLQGLRDFGRDRAGGMLVHAAYITGFWGEALADGRPRETKFHGRVGGGHQCDAPGCDQPGEFRAPPEQGPRGGFDGPGGWRWFCLDHVRAFNAGYNYFNGMSADEIEAEQRPYAGWERETRAFSATVGTSPRWSDFADPLDAIQARFRARAPAPRADGKPLSDADRRALRTLDLPADADRRALRTRYAELVRRFHPDRNGGDRSHEAQLAEVIAAYTHLKRAAVFA